MVVSSICGRWKNIHHAAHAAGYLLDPGNIKVDVTGKQETYTELQGGFGEVLGRLLSPAEVVTANLEWARYKKPGDISTEKPELVGKMPPLGVSNTLLGHFPVLLKEVCCVLDLRAGTRCVESHFSVMGAVHSKGRNRMVNTRVHKLTAVVTSNRIMDAAGAGFWHRGEEEGGTGLGSGGVGRRLRLGH